MKDSIFQHACLRAHTQALQQNESEYMMKLMAEMNTMSPAVKGTCFAALHLTGSHKALNETVQFWDIVSLYKMFSCLDAPRQARQLSEKIERIEVQHPHLIEMEEKTMLESTSSKRKSEEVATDVPIKRKRPRKIDGLRKKYDELQKEMNAHQCTACKDIHDNSAVAELISSASVSGSLARKVRTLWAPKLKPDYLEFVMLEMPKKTVWQFVSDLAHFKPADFSVPYFLADIFGESIPEDSFVYAMRNVMDAEKDDIAGTFRDVAARFPQVYKSYAFLRTKSHLTRSKAIVELLAENIPIDTAIWYFEELYSVARSTPQILAKRIQDNDLLNLAAISDSKVFTYGKLLERLLMFRKMNCRKMAEALMDVAASRLDALKERYMDNTRKKVVAVFGDASSSMTTAIEAAAIISSIVSTTLDGELSFFASDLVNSPHKKPSSVEETLEICTKIRANGCTNLASCLWPYYEQKKLVDTIVMVTDEFENSLCLGLHFAELLKKYKETVNPRVVLVLVRVGTGSKNFQNSLRANDIEAKVVMIDNSRPDLTKFDGLVGQIAAASQAVSDGDMGQSAKDADVEVCGDFVLVDDGN
eukprot:scaffold5605_cov128-Cylindrotheca_fusiformis.AAC.29